MANKRAYSERKSAQLSDQKVMRGQGGETHQIAGGDVRKTTHVACEISGSLIAVRIEQIGKF